MKNTKEIKMNPAKKNSYFSFILAKTEEISKTKLHEKYTSKKYSYFYIIANNIIFNNFCSIVSKYKDFLLYIDNNEFIHRYYTKKESLNRIKKITIRSAKIVSTFPNYIKIPERKFIYKNIFKKQKLLNKINTKITHEKVYFRKPKKNDILFTEDVKKELKEEEENTLLNNYNLNSSWVSFANSNNKNNNNSIESFITNNESNLSLYNIVDTMNEDKIYINDLQLLLTNEGVKLKNSNGLKKKTLDYKKNKIFKKINNNLINKKKNSHSKYLTNNKNEHMNYHINKGTNNIINTIQKKTSQKMKTTSKKKSVSKNKLQQKFISKPLLVSTKQCTKYENKKINKNIYNTNSNIKLARNYYNLHMKHLSSNNIQKIIPAIQQNNTTTNKTNKVKSKVKNIKRTLQINKNYNLKKEFQLPKLKTSNKNYLRHKHRSQDYGSKNILTEEAERPIINFGLKHKNASSKNTLKNFSMKKIVKKNKNFKENVNPNLITATNQNNYDNDDCDLDRANLIFCVNNFIIPNNSILINNNIDNSHDYAKTEQNFYRNNRYCKINNINSNYNYRNSMKHRSLSKKKSTDKNKEIIENKLKKQKTIKHMKNSDKENLIIKELFSFVKPSVFNNITKDFFKKNISRKYIGSRSKNTTIRSSKEKNNYNLHESHIVLSNHQSNSKIQSLNLNTETSKHEFQNKLIISEIKNISQKYMIETYTKNYLYSEGNLYEKNKNCCDYDYFKNKKINQGILDRINSIKNRINNGFYKIEQFKNVKKIGKSNSIKEIGVNKNRNLKCNKSTLQSKIDNININNKNLVHKNIFAMQKKKNTKTYINQLEHHDSSNTFESTGIIKVNKSKNLDKSRKELYLNTETGQSHSDLNFNK